MRGIVQASDTGSRLTTNCCLPTYTRMIRNTDIKIQEKKFVFLNIRIDPLSSLPNYPVPHL
jgi:hypothetical protein